MRRKKLNFLPCPADVMKKIGEFADENVLIRLSVSSDKKYRIAVSFRSDVPDKIEMVRKYYGGYYTPPGDNPYHWLSLQQHRAYMFMTYIGPYMKKKKGQYELVMKMKKRIDDNNMRKLTDEERKARLLIIEEIRELNRDFIK